MRVPLLAGRDLDVTDHAGTPVVLVVNQELVRRFFPGENVVGKVLQTGKQQIQIVGVVGNIRQRGLGEAVEPTMYIHALQNMRSGMSIVVRTRAEPLRLANAVRSAIWSLDRNQPIAEITTLESVLGGTVARQKLLAWLLGIFGVLGLVLGALGIYGLLVFTVSQRRQEIGVRAALGAPASAVLRLIIGQGMMLALAGVVIGVVAARLLTRQMQAELFQITAGDVGTFVEVIAVLLATSLVASWWPARRALAIQPVTAMRYD
jgi:predicted lysophospholipase L1 biosynthesis ABC-type transport system permease subunit